MDYLFLHGPKVATFRHDSKLPGTKKGPLRARNVCLGPSRHRSGRFLSLEDLPDQKRKQVSDIADLFSV